MLHLADKSVYACWVSHWSVFEIYHSHLHWNWKPWRGVGRRSEKPNLDFGDTQWNIKVLVYRQPSVGNIILVTGCPNVFSILHQIIPESDKAGETAQSSAIPRRKWPFISWSNWSVSPITKFKTPEQHFMWRAPDIPTSCHHFTPMMSWHQT